MVGKNYITLQLLDDVSNNEKNMQMHNLNDPRDLVDKEDKVRDWDSEKNERFERSWSKSLTMRLLKQT